MTRQQVLDLARKIVARYHPAGTVDPVTRNIDPGWAECLADLDDLVPRMHEDLQVPNEDYCRVVAQMHGLVCPEP